MHFYLFCKDNDTFSVRVHYDILEKWKEIGTIDIISLKKKLVRFLSNCTCNSEGIGSRFLDSLSLKSVK